MQLLCHNQIDISIRDKYYTFYYDNVLCICSSIDTGVRWFMTQRLPP